jgi:thiol-disulfide isomerase/thioredoxin
MKKIVSLIAFMTILNGATAQVQYEVSTAQSHSQRKVLRGIITKYLLSSDSSFSWYQVNQKSYTPDTGVLNSMQMAKGKIQFVVFGGTWCEDTQLILPRFFKLQEMAGISDNQISFFGVNEAKQTLGNITAAFGITNVPTIIVMKDNKEVGRVVEYGKTGKWDKELADLVR